MPFNKSHALSQAISENELFLIDGSSHINPRAVGVICQLQLTDAIQTSLGRRTSR
ncbi:hypothetical protein [Pelagibius sp. Alg239-R121]|uniref:hypothetical protein n=1 Tax=Pelagibius sp. Alg239-R121 TaxID=2993448 RepID=UPI0024A757B3|nr:hypothetical protein [Pelagibius sp. Alg239-R121]